MNEINQFISYILEFESYVLIPIILFILALIIGMKIGNALKSVITIGVGFIGLGLIFAFFIEKLSPVVEGLVSNLGLEMSAFDAGWTPLAIGTWSMEFAGFGLVLILVTNVILLLMRMTRTINIDIFNYWHMLFVGSIIYVETNSSILALIGSVVTSIFILKCADWVAKDFEEFSELESLTTTTLSCVAYYPYAVVTRWIFDRIPVVKDLNADAEGIQKRFGMLGEPIIIGTIIGVALGIGAKYNVKSILELGVQFAAIIYLLPKMAGALAEGLKPISEHVSSYIKKKFPTLGKIYIGVDIAVILGDPSIIVTGIILIPITIILALVLPGVKYIPLGDLSVMMVLSAVIVVVNKGNVIRGILTTIPLIISHLYVGSYMAARYTKFTLETGVDLKGYSGEITSFVDGGNSLRFWLMEMFTGKLWAFIAIPFVLIFMFIAYRLTEKEAAINTVLKK